MILPKIKLSTFHEDNIRGWIRKCRKFFKLHSTLVHQWVEIVSLYLEDKKKVWFKGFLIRDYDTTNWEEFV
jgi:hypothetical protein